MFDKIKITKSEYNLLKVKALGLDAMIDWMTKDSETRRKRFNRLMQASTDFQSGKIDRIFYDRICKELLAEISNESSVIDRRTD